MKFLDPLRKCYFCGTRAGRMANVPEFGVYGAIKRTLYHEIYRVLLPHDIFPELVEPTESTDTVSPKTTVSYKSTVPPKDTVLFRTTVSSQNTVVRKSTIKEQSTNLKEMLRSSCCISRGEWR